MRIRDIEVFKETATCGSTSSNSVSSNVNPGTKKTKKRQTHNADGTIKNAVETDRNIFSGQPIKRKPEK